MKTFGIKSGLLAGLLLGSVHASAQTFHYNHRPIRIHLKPQVERWISFPERVQVDARGSGLTQGMLRLLNNQGTLYLTAYRPFSQRRLLVRLLHSGKTVLVDVKSDHHGVAIPITVTLKQSRPARCHASKYHPRPAQHRTVNLLQLIRFAIVQLYSQHTLSIISPHLIKTPAFSANDYRAVQAMFHNKALHITPRVQWRTRQTPHVTITAVQIKNTGHRTITLHPEQLCGHFKAASVYPFTRLNGRSKPGHETTLFLIADQSLITARRDC